MINASYVTGNIAWSGEDEVHSSWMVINEETHRVVGFIHAESCDLLYNESGFNIWGLAVLSGCRRMGIGKRLLQAVENEAAARNCRFIRLNSSEQRTEAHLFYERCGYKYTKLQKRFIKEW